MFRSFDLRVLLLSLLFSLFFLPLWPSLVTATDSASVPENMRQCERDDDCSFVETSCSSCCQFKGINKKNEKDFYATLLKPACSDYTGPVCDCAGDLVFPVCKNGHCQYSDSDDFQINVNKSPSTSSDTSRYGIILLNLENQSMNSISKLRQMTEMSSDELNDLLSTLPKTIWNNLSKEEVDNITQILDEIDAQYEIIGL